jgi:hypothetical protein
MIPDLRNGCLGFDRTRRTSRAYGCLHRPVLWTNNPLGLPVIRASNLQPHWVRIISGPSHRNPVQEHRRPDYSHKRNPIIIPPTGSFRSDFDGVVMQAATQPSRMWSFVVNSAGRLNAYSGRRTPWDTWGISAIGVQAARIRCRWPGADTARMSTSHRFVSKMRHGACVGLRTGIEHEGILPLVFTLRWVSAGPSTRHRPRLGNKP